MRRKRINYEQGFLDLSSAGFGVLHCTGVINHQSIDFELHSDECWYYAFESNKFNLAILKDAQEYARIENVILGYALLHVEDGGI